MAKLINAEELYNSVLKLFLLCKDSKNLHERIEAGAYDKVLCLIDQAHAAGFTGEVAQLIGSEEIKRLAPDALIWLDNGRWEYANGERILTPIFPVCFVKYDIEDYGDGPEDILRFTDGIKNLADYGKKWLAWTAKPTDEQRYETREVR